MANEDMRTYSNIFVILGTYMFSQNLYPWTPFLLPKHFKQIKQRQPKASLMHICCTYLNIWKIQKLIYYLLFDNRNVD